MKPKIILGLALVLSGCLFGCVTKPDTIDQFVASLSGDYGLWVNGIDLNRITQATSPEELISKLFLTETFQSGRVTNYQILKIRKVHIGDFPDPYIAVLANTNLGRMIVLMQYIEKGSRQGHWWLRVYDANQPYGRLY